MIDEKKLIEEIKNRRNFWISKASKYDAIKDEMNTDICDGKAMELEVVMKMIQEQPKTDEWIPCSESMPEEHEEQQPIIDSATLAEIDVRYYTVSDRVQVTIEDETGRRFVCDDCTVNGRWYNFNEDLGFEVLAWQPLPEPWRGEADGE